MVCILVLKVTFNEVDWYSQYKLSTCTNSVCILFWTWDTHHLTGHTILICITINLLKMIKNFFTFRAIFIICKLPNLINSIFTSICLNVKNHCKKKVKLSLCLTNYHAMTTYPMINYAPHDEDILRSGSTAPHILKLGIWLGCVISFTLRPLYPQGKSPQYPFDRWLGGPQTQSGHGGDVKKITSLPLLEIKPQSSRPQPSHYTDRVILTRTLWVKKQVYMPG
jgi:hypothetical protein